MLCKDCKDKPVIRGIKQVECLKCGENTIVNFAYSNICTDCSDTYLICQCCGKEIENDFSVYALSWLETAVDNFKKQNKVVHSVKSDMSIGEFIKTWAKYEMDKIVRL